MTAFPCVSTSSPLTYVWAFGFVGCILFPHRQYFELISILLNQGKSYASVKKNVSLNPLRPLLFTAWGFRRYHSHLHSCHSLPFMPTWDSQCCVQQQSVRRTPPNVESSSPASLRRARTDGRMIGRLARSCVFIIYRRLSIPFPGSSLPSLFEHVQTTVLQHSNSLLVDPTAQTFDQGKPDIFVLYGLSRLETWRSNCSESLLRASFGVYEGVKLGCCEFREFHFETGKSNSAKKESILRHPIACPILFKQVLVPCTITWNIALNISKTKRQADHPHSCMCAYIFQTSLYKSFAHDPWISKLLIFGHVR